MSAPEENRDSAGGQIPEVSVDALISLGITDLPRTYFRVTSIDDAGKPVIEMEEIDNSAKTLDGLGKLDRAMLREALLARAAFTRDRDILLATGGLGYPERLVSSIDLSIMQRLSPALQIPAGLEYKYLVTGSPRDYLMSYVHKPQVGDVVISERTWSGNYSANPRTFTLNPLAQDSMSSGNMDSRVVIFRPQPNAGAEVK